MIFPTCISCVLEEFGIIGEVLAVRAEKLSKSRGRYDLQ